MDDLTLQKRLRRIKQLQYLILVSLGVPYLYLIADYIGFALAGALYAVIGALIFGVIAVYRRGYRDTVRQ